MTVAATLLKKHYDAYAQGKTLERLAKAEQQPSSGPLAENDQQLLADGQAVLTQLESRFDRLVAQPTLLEQANDAALAVAGLESREATQSASPSALGITEVVNAAEYSPIGGQLASAVNLVTQHVPAVVEGRPDALESVTWGLLGTVAGGTVKEAKLALDGVETLAQKQARGWRGMFRLRTLPDFGELKGALKEALKKPDLGFLQKFDGDPFVARAILAGRMPAIRKVVDEECERVLRMGHREMANPLVQRLVAMQNYFTDVAMELAGQGQLVPSGVARFRAIQANRAASYALKKLTPFLDSGQRSNLAAAPLAQLRQIREALAKAHKMDANASVGKLRP